MAKIVVKTNKIIENIEKINQIFKSKKYKWTLILKMLSGNEAFLKKIIYNKVIKNIHSIGDSRISGLKKIKQINPKIKTMYIKPPPIQIVKSIISFADISVNSSYKTILALNKEAKRQNKVHEIIIMLEMGELREGVLPNKILSFYTKIFSLKNIKVIGLGTNLGCLYGVEPTYDKLLQLNLYKKLLEQKFYRKIPLISGGSSITLPLIDQNKIPKDVNHFRIGEAVFFGTSPLTTKKYRNLNTDNFEFVANIIELEIKSTSPKGKLSEGNIGHFKKNKENNKTYRAILDFGILDVDYKDLVPKNKKNIFVGITSDMCIYDLGTKNNDFSKQKYYVGGNIKFKINYMAVARLLNSKFIEIEFN